MQTDRDPRKDPRPGDVVGKAEISRTITDVTAVWVRFERVVKGRTYSRWNRHRVWRKWAKGAEVIHAAD
jgi:hypothetical protein